VIDTRDRAPYLVVELRGLYQETRAARCLQDAFVMVVIAGIVMAILS